MRRHHVAVDNNSFLGYTLLNKSYDFHIERSFTVATSSADWVKRPGIA